ncbi:hypothetical protein Lal_00032878 [Lupinus albus]|nr:hypothetical protein Lal_00032878 [Lupinus albus]
MLSPSQEWAIFYRQRFGKYATPSTRYFKSSIRHGIKSNRSLANLKSLFLVGCVLANPRGSSSLSLSLCC